MSALRSVGIGLAGLAVGLVVSAGAVLAMYSEGHIAIVGVHRYEAQTTDGDARSTGCMVFEARTGQGHIAVVYGEQHDLMRIGSMVAISARDADGGRSTVYFRNGRANAPGTRSPSLFNAREPDNSASVASACEGAAYARHVNIETYFD